ncbi:MAG: glucosidase [Planctomycetota bacterium]
MSVNAERARLREADAPTCPWRLWGPYLSERQWGTVREDYSADGSAWDYFTHDASRSRAYRWGEDGLAGFSDDHQRLCFSLALWNERDPILKERLFGLTGSEGNHGEDVKELYYYLDATPTHSYLKMLYKYPHSEFPYRTLVEGNRARGRDIPELELLETGVYDENRYFDVQVEYAKAQPDDIVIAITVTNRGPDPARLHVLPQAWFRNTWSWEASHPRPMAHRDGDRIVLTHEELGAYSLECQAPVEWLFCENETNAPKLFGAPAEGPFKDAFHEYVVHGHRKALATEHSGTKVAARVVLDLEGGESQRLLLRLHRAEGATSWSRAARVLERRREEADAFHAELEAEIPTTDRKRVHRQALAGMIWSQQYYELDIPKWLQGDPGQPPPPESRKLGRNAEWEHLNNAEVLSMPDKWEYPWYAAWDLAFHCLPLALVDPAFAKHQLVLLTREWYMHPSGQLPAYEWAFSDVNPPVHAWATWRVFEIDRERSGGPGDFEFLERVFHKLLLNFTWWVNRKDPTGRNIFQGGFLGLDNIGVFDRSAPLPTGGQLLQSDGTSWMAMYSLNMMRIAVELATNNPVYQDLATKFFEHFLYIAAAMNDIGGEGISLWSESDEFFYDVLCLPNGEKRPLAVRSMVGLLPLCAVEVLTEETLARVPEFEARLKWFLDYRPDLAKLVSRWHEPGKGETHLLSLLRGHRMKCVLRRMLDAAEFLSPHGVRALSKYHEAAPYVLEVGDRRFEVGYQPGESESGLFGGNSNWRGPIWMPVNYLLIESLRRFHRYYGDDFRVEHPTGSGELRSLAEIADELSERLVRLFLKDESGRRPIFGEIEKQQTDPHFRDHLLFHEYFHGETGRGLGASHQTGWTGLVAALLHPTVARSCSSCATHAAEEPVDSQVPSPLKHI